jgi:cbb3-type cytochrome oxidase subunit 3
MAMVGISFGLLALLFLGCVVADFLVYRKHKKEQKNDIRTKV